MKACVVLGGGSDLVEVGGYDLVICADSGYSRLKPGYLPTHLVGDMDSISPEDLEIAMAKGIATSIHPAEKDFSDGEAAISLALSEGADDLTIEGTLGNRTDHLLSTFALLHIVPATVRCRLRIGSDLIYLIRSGEEMTLKGPPPIISLVPACGGCVVSTFGTKYDLDREELGLGSTRGIHNEPVSESPRITVHSGAVFLVLCSSVREHGA
jgi:thiamine pyrophosphokinase